MVQAKRKLTESDIKSLVKSYSAYKKAELDFKKLKSELTDKLPLGRYESKYGNVIKSPFVRNVLNTNRLFEEHPELNRDEYVETTETTCVNIQNLK